MSLIVKVPKHFQYKRVFQWFITVKSCSQLKADIKWFGLGKVVVTIVHICEMPACLQMHIVFVYLFSVYSICVCLIYIQTCPLYMCKCIVNTNDFIFVV